MLNQLPTNVHDMFELNESYSVLGSDQCWIERTDKSCFADCDQAMDILDGHPSRVSVAPAFGDVKDEVLKV